MATKTIRIDSEAYRRLENVRQKNESFSQTIKRIIRAPIDFEKWMASIEKDPQSEKAVEAIISRRRTPRSRRR
jgi:predicted CopG family antitoxin